MENPIKNIRDYVSPHVFDGVRLLPDLHAKRIQARVNPALEWLFYVVKRNKRLWIVHGNGASVQFVYTPPDFVKLPSRSPLETLAKQMTACGRRDIEMIARFEFRYGPKHRQSRSSDSSL
jgi:hypothetical protein